MLKAFVSKKIRVIDDLVNLNDIATILVKSKQPMVYSNKQPMNIKVKKNGDDYVSVDNAINIIKSARAKEAKEFIKELEDNNDIEEIKEINEELIVVKQNNIIDPKNKMFVFDGMNVKYIIDKEDNIWFKGKDICEVLEYKDTVDAISKHVNEKYKKPFQLLGQGVLPPLEKNKKSSDETVFFSRGNDSLPLTYNEKNTIYINEAGLYKLIFKSKMKKAEQFSDWVAEEVLPSIRKTGQYNVSQSIKSFYDDNLISDYDEKPVFYLGVINIDNEIYYKYGISRTMFNRDVKQHRKHFENFNIIYIIESSNIEEIEKKFKTILMSRELLTKIKGYNNKEIFKTDNIQEYINIVKDLVKKFPLKEVEDRNNKIMLLEDTVKQKDKEENKRYQQQIETTKLEIEKLKEQTKQRELDKIEELTKQKEIDILFKEKELEELTKQKEIDKQVKVKELEELTKQKEIDKQIEIEREKTKQMQLEFEILKLKMQQNTIVEKKEESELIEKKQNNIYLDFINEKIKKGKSSFYISELYILFSEWLKTQKNINIIPIKALFTTEIKKYYDVEIVYRYSNEESKYIKKLGIKNIDYK